jgi:predicted transcriptional regulator YheO
MSYNKFGVNTSNSFNTPPKAVSSKLINRLAEMGYVDPNQAAKAVKDYLKTGSLASFAYLVNAKKGKV